METIKVEVIQELSPETGIIIKPGTQFWYTQKGPGGWPIIESMETTTSWDIALEGHIEDDDSEVREYIKPIE